jgi:hypothetical protein
VVSQDFTVAQIAVILGVRTEALKARIRAEKWRGKNRDGERVFPYCNMPEDVQSAIMDLRGMMPADIQQRVQRLKRLVEDLNGQIAAIEGVVGLIHQKENA